MKFKKWIILLIIIGVGVFVYKANFTGKDQAQFTYKEYKPFYGDIVQSIAASGTIKPSNRLEVKPPLSGRLERLYVVEGSKVWAGDVIGLMSSSERAALIDAAKTKGAETLKFWEENYKATPIIAPITGEIIVRGFEPGQMISESDAIVVIADKLVVKATVDETDIGKVKVGQDAVIKLDAYPDVAVPAKVSHIAYESKIVNNVTMYEVEILPKYTAKVFRSGMSADVEIIQQTKKHVILLPNAAVENKNDKNFVLVKKAETVETVPVEVGLTDDTNTEIVSGLTDKDLVVTKERQYKLTKQSSGQNPFMPSRPKSSRTSSSTTKASKTAVSSSSSMPPPPN